MDTALDTVNRPKAHPHPVHRPIRRADGQHPAPTRATSRFPLPLLALLLGVGLCVLVAHLPAAAHDLLPADDHRDVVEESVLHLDRTFFLANDNATGDEKIVIVDPPRFGHLTKVFEDGFRYTSDGPFLGVDSFTYRLVTRTTASPPARVTLRFLDQFQPLAGRWPTSSCNPLGCPDTGCVDGEGTEIGFYDRATHTFSLCDWQGSSRLEDCRLLEVPQSLRPVRGGMPLVLDWDGDGLDELALHDPETGVVNVFAETAAPCPGEEKGLCLELVATVDLAVALGAAARHVTPFADAKGAEATGFGETLAAYDSVARVAHLGFDGHEFGTTIAFDHGPSALAVRGGWQGHGRETLGLWSPIRKSFAYLVDATGDGIIEITPQLSNDLLVPAWPLPVAANRCAPAMLGLWNPCRGLMMLQALDQPLGDHASVYVNVPTDPAGYPSQWPPCTVQ